MTIYLNLVHRYFAVFIHNFGPGRGGRYRNTYTGTGTRIQYARRYGFPVLYRKKYLFGTGIRYENSFNFFCIENKKQEFFAMGIRYENSFNFFSIENKKQEFFAMEIRYENSFNFFSGENKKQEFFAMGIRYVAVPVLQKSIQVPVPEVQVPVLLPSTLVP